MHLFSSVIENDMKSITESQEQIKEQIKCKEKKKSNERINKFIHPTNELTELLFVPGTEQGNCCAKEKYKPWVLSPGV